MVSEDLIIFYRDQNQPLELLYIIDLPLEIKHVNGHVREHVKLNILSDNSCI
jgi:hypothetical protein